MKIRFINLFFLLHVFFFTTLTLSAQIRQTIDSLEKILPEVTKKQRVDVLNELAWNYKYYDLNTCKSYAEEATELASKIGYNNGLAYAERNLGVYNFLTNNIQESEKHLMRCIQISKENDLLFQEAKALNLIGVISRENYNYAKAIEYHQSALAIYQKLKMQEEISGVLNNLGLVYDAIHESDKALEIYLQVLEFEEFAGNAEGISRTSANIGNILLRMKEYERAVQVFSKAVEAGKKSGNNNFLASAYHGLGNAYREVGNTEAAIESFELAATTNRIAGNENWLASNYQNLAVMYLDKNDFQTGLRLIDTAIAICVKNNRLKDLSGALAQKGFICFKIGDLSNAEKFIRESVKISDSIDVLSSESAYKNLSDIEKQKGNYQTALNYLEKSLELKDSLNKMEKSNILIELATKYDTKQKDVENLHLKSVNELNKQIIINQRIIFAASLVFLIFLSILVIILFRGQKRLKAANFELLEKTNEISVQSERLAQLNATKDRLFSIIAHDLKNPFNAILGFSEIAVDEVEKYNNTELSNIILLIKNSAERAYNLLENLLEWSRSQQGKISFHPGWINAGESLNEMISLFNGQLTQKMISIENNIPESFYIFSDQNMFETIMRNLLANAVKFTAPNGTIILSGVKSETKNQIIVADTGVGISREVLDKLFRIDQVVTTVGTGNEKGTGIGLILCKEFIEKHNGTIEVLSNEGKGSQFIVSFPNPSTKNN